MAAAQPAARSKDLMRAMKEAAQGIGMRGGREVRRQGLELSCSLTAALTGHASQPCITAPGRHPIFSLGAFHTQSGTFAISAGQQLSRHLIARFPMPWCVVCAVLSSSTMLAACGDLQVPLDELDLRRLRDAADEMREQLSVSSRAVSKGWAATAVDLLYE